MKAALVLAALALMAGASLSAASADTKTCYAISGHGPCLTKAASVRKHHPIRRHSRHARHRNSYYAYSDAAPVMTAPLPPPMSEPGQPMMDYGPPPPMPGAPVYNFYGPTQNFFGPTTNYFGGYSGPAAAYPGDYPPPDDGRMDPWRGYDHRDGLRNGY